MNLQNFFAGVMSSLLACSGGALLIIHVAETAGFTRTELVTWMFAVYVLGGILNVVMTVRYQIPFGGAHSITAVAFLASTASQFTIHELAAGYVLSGLLIVGLGMSGMFKKVLDFIPKVFIDALLAGVILNYVMKVIPSVSAMPLVGGLTIVGYVITLKMIKAVPPFIGALVWGILGLFIAYDFPNLSFTTFIWPQPLIPSFTMPALISIAIPISVLILTNDIAVALVALKSNGYNPPVNKTMIMSGAFTSVAGVFAGHAANMGGMMSALCSGEEAGSREQRTWAAIVSGSIVILFGLFLG
ncbi:benzoate/H(+) symporter BenE family transporter [Paenibacillus sp. N3.4]|uniref:benzoate/H(+) symporter BenE family transporter n=1 Tax=Paenibacillus sp. N3.4 TaxID=2603222 RepID=UPI0011CA0377|nr:benzoate/H(+) symporter BenE family transporter [Paenibacillus sp. N3.4]TXK76959.1 benzoate transporter [Paenibacillus sp. N3.4]